MKRGEIWWADLPEPIGSEPGYRHPVLIVSSNLFNQTQIDTVLGLILTSNLDYARSYGNIFLSGEETGLPMDSVINITQLTTIDKTFLDKTLRMLPVEVMKQVDEGLKLVLELRNEPY